MKITCHSCGAKYTVSDDKVQGKTVKMKCRKCSATIVIGGSAGEASDDAARIEPESPPVGSYLVNVSDGDQRTMTIAEIVEAYNAGVIAAETYIFADGMADWQALQENDRIVAALNEAASAATAMKATTPEPAPVASSSSPFGAPMSSPMSAPMDSGFGDSSRPAARRDVARKSPDLFGGGYGSGPSSSMGGMAALSAPSPSTGGREENSVLFSLNALTATGPAAPKPSVAGGTKEDSGLIDLRALAAAAPAAPAPAPVDTLGLFPLGAPPVSAAPSPMMAIPTTGAEPQKRSPLPLILAGIAAVCGIIGVFLLVSRDDKKDTETVSKTAEVVETKSAPTTPTATATESAPALVATSDPTADPSASASTAPVAVKGPLVRTPGTKATGKTTSSPAPTATTTTTAKKPTNNCNCPPGNLDCALKCSVGRK